MLAVAVIPALNVIGACKMADANVNETVYIPVEELPGIGEVYGDVGVVVYNNTFNVNGVLTLIISG